MAKICSSCHYTAGDNEVFCPACGTYLDSSNADPSAYGYMGAGASQPLNDGSTQPIATQLYKQANHPAEQNAYGQSGPSPKGSGRAGRLPFIIIGVAAAALIFVVVLIAVMNSRGIGKKNTGGASSVPAATQAAEEELAGTYSWKDNSEGLTGSLTISNNNVGVFSLDSGGSVTITFDTQKKEASYSDSSGKLQTGTYVLSEGVLTIKVNGYTDFFTKQ